MKIDLFGQVLEVEENTDGWHVYLVGAGGKERAASALVIPSRVQVSAVISVVGEQ
ncbi:MAG: hypothetical protein NZ578_04575 [Candidatus Binatia bacterium]|nr:hypothetical protein [Candidatus Binatia bacterium]